MDPQLKSNLTSSKHWIRLIYMVLFAFAVYVAGIVIGLVIIVQFLFALITGSANRNLRSLGSSLSTFIQQALDFLTFNSEQKPFPFADWPQPAFQEPIDDVVPGDPTPSTVVVEVSSVSVEEVEVEVDSELEKPKAKKSRSSKTPTVTDGNEPIPGDEADPPQPKPN